MNLKALFAVVSLAGFWTGGCGAQNQESKVQSLLDTQHRIVLGVVAEPNSKEFSLRACTAKLGSSTGIIEKSPYDCINPLQTPDDKPATFNAIPSNALAHLNSNGTIKRTIGLSLGGTTVALVAVTSLASLGVLPGVATAIGLGAGSLIATHGLISSLKPNSTQATEAIKDIAQTRIDKAEAMIKSANVAQRNKTLELFEEQAQVALEDLKKAERNSAIAWRMRKSVENGPFLKEELVKLTSEKTSLLKRKDTLWTEHKNLPRKETEKRSAISENIKTAERRIASIDEAAAAIREKLTEIKSTEQKLENIIISSRDHDLEVAREHYHKVKNNIQTAKQDLLQAELTQEQALKAKAAHEKVIQLAEALDHKQGDTKALEQALEKADATAIKAKIVTLNTRIKLFVSSGAKFLTIAGGFLASSEFFHWAKNWGANAQEASNVYLFEKDNFTAPHSLSDGATARGVIKEIAKELNLKAVL